jgi:hypothetical protein
MDTIPLVWHSRIESSQTMAGTTHSVAGKPTAPPAGHAHSRPHRAGTASPQQGFYPGLGAGATTLGTLLAIAAVPFDPQKEGALFVSGLLMSIGLATAPVAAFISNPRNILRAENIVGLAPIYWLFLDLVTAHYDMPMVTDVAVQAAFLSVGMFTVMFWVGAMSRPWRLPKPFLASCAYRPDVRTILPVAIICFLIAMMSFVIPCKLDLGLMFRSLLSNRWSAPWSRGEMGGWSSFTDHLSYFGYLLPTFGVMIMRRKGFLHPATLLALAMSVIYLMFIMHGGARRIVGVILGAALTFWILDRERVRIWHLTVAACITAAILWIMQAMLVVRSAGVGTIGLENAGKIALYTMKGDQAIGGTPKGLAVDDNFYRLVQIHSLIPEYHPFVYWRQVYYVICRPIPRVLWEVKPIDGGFSLETFDAKGASLSCSIVGEMWMSLGYAAVLLGGWLFGRVARMGDPLFNVAKGSVGPMFYGYLTMIGVVGWRSMVELLLFSYALIGWVVATWIHSKIRGR